ncbi:hypothetical protein FB451DRAFT_1549293 [Mycena latifolia]|nr:hypothetical protein FB451DRAFT_1549293 [Mycena latifolia]
MLGPASHSRVGNPSFASQFQQYFQVFPMHCCLYPLRRHGARGKSIEILANAQPAEYHGPPCMGATTKSRAGKCICAIGLNLVRGAARAGPARRSMAPLVGVEGCTRVEQGRADIHSYSLWVARRRACNGSQRRAARAVLGQAKALHADAACCVCLNRAARMTQRLYLSTHRSIMSRALMPAVRIDGDITAAGICIHLHLCRRWRMARGEAGTAGESAGAQAEFARMPAGVIALERL